MAADIIRTLVEDIVLTPADCELEIDVRGDLAGILTLGDKQNGPDLLDRGRSTTMVAGARNARDKLRFSGARKSSA